MRRVPENLRLHHLFRNLSRRVPYTCDGFPADRDNLGNFTVFRNSPYRFNLTHVISLFFRKSHENSTLALNLFLFIKSSFENRIESKDVRQNYDFDRL